MAGAAPTFPVTDRTKMRRKAKRSTYDRDIIHKILDDALIASVAVSIDGQPHVQPMIHVRDGDQIILHGLATNRLLDHVSKGGACCINVAMVDALVLARKIEDHSMLYRSASVYGRGALVEDAAEKERLMFKVFDHLVRSDRLRHLPPLPDGYLGGTMVVLVPITEAVGKVNDDVPTDDGPDDIWSGLVPVRMARHGPIPDQRTIAEDARKGEPGQ